MKLHLFVLIVFQLAGYFYMPEDIVDDKNILSLKIFQRGSYNLDKSTDYYSLVDARLTNNSDSVINFLILSCSVYNNFLIEPQSVFIVPNDCNRNTTYPVKLYPKQCISVPLILRFSKNNNWMDQKIRIGFILITRIDHTKPLSDSIDLFKISNRSNRNKGNIFWSDYFTLYHGAEPFIIEN